MVSENEALQKYVKHFHYEKSHLTDEEIVEIKEAERGSYGFQRYMLYLAMEDVKQAIFNELPGWLQMILKGGKN